MRQDIAERNLAGNAVALFVYDHCGNAHDIAAITRRGLQSLNGMTSGASQAVLVKRAVNLGVLCEAAGQHDNRIVAAITVARELDALGADQDVDARPVERRAE